MKRIINEDKGERQVQDERIDETAEEEPDDQDEEEEDEGEDTHSVKIYVKAQSASMMMKEIPIPLPHRKVTYNYDLYFCPMSC